MRFSRERHFRYPLFTFQSFHALVIIHQINPAHAGMAEMLEGEYC